MSEIKIKPCPFCGNTKLVETLTPKKKMVQIACSKCRLVIQNFFPTKEEAYEFWNTRFNPRNKKEKKDA